MFRMAFIGNLGKDPEVKQTKAGGTFVKLNVGVRVWNGKENSTVWVGVSAFGKTAEYCEKYLKKGSRIYAEGTPSAHAYTDKNGQVVGSLEMMAQTVENCERRGEGTGEAAPAAMENVTEAAAGELPF